MEIIGLSGKAGSGKDFIGKHVLEPLGYKKWALAWPMKNESFGENRNWTYDMVHRDKPENVRTWLQKRGTEEGWMRHDQDYWLRIAKGWLETMEKEWGQTRFYIPDVRFPHEVTYIQQVLGGKVVRITGRQSSRLTPEQASHLSETALDEWILFDGYLNNDAHATVSSLQVALNDLGVVQLTRLSPPVQNGVPYWHTLYDEAMRNIAP